MSTLAVQQRNVRSHRAWRTRWSFPVNQAGQAQRWYSGLNAFNGWAKRLVLVHDDGTVEVLDRKEW